MSVARGAGRGEGAGTRGPINPNSKLGQLYRVLKDAQGGWLSNWTLTTRCQLTAVSTRCSELRARLPRGERLESEVRRDADGRLRWFYRLLRDNGPQGEIPVDFGGATVPTPAQTARFMDFEAGRR